MTNSINVNISDLALVMKQMGDANKASAPTKKGAYEEGKVYVKIGNHNRLISVVGKRGKDEKDLNADQLIQIVKKTVEVSKTGFDTAKSASELGDVISGLQAMKGRMSSYKNEMSAVKRFILNLFGVFNKTDYLVSEIDKTIKVTQKYQINNEIALLKNEMETLKSEITKLEESNEKLSNNKGFARLENETKLLEDELGSLTDVLEKKKAALMARGHQKLTGESTINEKIGENARAIKKQSIKLENAEKTYEDAKKAKKITGTVKGAKTLFGKKETLAQDNYKNAEEGLKRAKSELKNENDALKGLLAEKKVLEIQLKQNEVNFEPLKKEIVDVKRKVDKITLTLEENKSALKTRTELERKIEEISSKERTLSEKKAALAKLTGNVKEAPIAQASIGLTLSKAASSSPLFIIPDTPGTLLHSRQLRLMDEIQSNLGLKGSSKEKELYLRKMVFGFSVGQKFTIEEMSRLDSTLNVEDLKKMLEGGSGLVNLFYVAHYLEHYIPSISSANLDKSAQLMSLQSDLKRSLPFALRLRSIELSSPISREKNLTALLSDIKTNLAQLKPGERLLLPIGTSDHETLLVLQKKEDGGIEATYYNTGDGVDQNMATGISLKAVGDFLRAGFTGKFPIKKTFPSADLNKNIEPMLLSVLKNRMEDGSIADINGHLSTNLGEGKSGEAKEAQINGVCSFQVLSEAFQDILGSPKSFLSFQRDFLTHLQQEFKQTAQRKPPPQNEIEMKVNQRLLQDNQQEIKEIEKRLAAQAK